MKGQVCLAVESHEFSCSTNTQDEAVPRMILTESCSISDGSWRRHKWDTWQVSSLTGLCQGLLRTRFRRHRSKHDHPRRHHLPLGRHATCNVVTVPPVWASSEAWFELRSIIQGGPWHVANPCQIPILVNSSRAQGFSQQIEACLDGSSSNVAGDVSDDGKFQAISLTAWGLTVRYDVVW